MNADIPEFIDAHVHLDLLPDPEAAVSEAVNAGVGRLLAVGIDLKSSRLAVQFAERFSQVLACVGIHPHDAGDAGQKTVDELKRLAAAPRTVAIGETGLDYYRDRAPREIQARAFRLQIQLARETGLPLVVHTRDAAGDTMEILDREAQGLTVILHCFSLTDQVDECARRGYFMSVAGNVTFKNAAALREAVKAIPDDLLLTETDCPFLTPVPYRGKPNRPAYVAYVARELAGIRGVSESEIAAIAGSNFIRAFA